MLRVDYDVEVEDLDAGMKPFWDLESLGILKEEHPVQQQFSQRITFEKGRYEVHLLWEQSHPELPDNYDLCKKRLCGLLKRLSQNPEQLQLYDSIFQEQLQQGVVETTKLRVVYDASAKTDGPSLNDCLHTGHNFGQNILEILLRFLMHHVALVGDVEKAFLMVSVAECDRNVLRFLWVARVNQPHQESIVMRFTRESQPANFY